MIKKLKHPKKLIYFSLGLFFFTYVFARSILVGITFDEAWTIGAFVRGSFYNIFAGEPAIANNHLLNSFFDKIDLFLRARDHFFSKVAQPYFDARLFIFFL